MMGRCGIFVHKTFKLTVYFVRFFVSFMQFLGSYALHTDPIVRGNLVSQCVTLRTRRHVTDLREYKIVWQVHWVLVIPSCFVGHYCFHRVVVVVYL